MSDNGDAFSIEAMNDALEAIKDLKGVQAAGPPADTDEAKAKARAHGFVLPTAYDYSLYERGPTALGPEGDDENATMPPREWASNAARYEFEDEYGDIGPRVPELEEQLFKAPTIVRTGIHMSKLHFRVKLEGPEQIKSIEKFEDAGLHPVILENIKLCQYADPTPVQMYCIPAVLKGYDVVACAQTGSGKTAAYLIPMLSKLAGKYKSIAAKRPSARNFDSKTDRVRAEPLILIVVPTRELATQIFDETRRLSYRTMFRPCVAYGGGPRSQQQLDLQRGCDILIATPGRLMDFLGNPNVLTLRRLKYTVIDEADEMLDADWEQEMGRIMGGGDNNEDPDHLYMMFSATFPPAARKLAREYMKETYIRIRVGRAGSTHGNITQRVIYVQENMKRKALWDLLFSCKPGRTLIFVNSKRQAEMLDDYLFNLGLPSTSIHSDRTQREREDAMRAFKHGSAPILITTGFAARGLDIVNVVHVINYDLPNAQHGGIGEYVHRIGRTARIGNAGLASSFFNDRNEDIADDLVKVLLESKQEVPDFLQDRIPEELIFDDVSEKSDDEDNKETENGWSAPSAKKNGDGAQAQESSDFKFDEGAGAASGTGGW